MIKDAAMTLSTQHPESSSKKIPVWCNQCLDWFGKWPEWQHTDCRRGIDPLGRKSQKMTSHFASVAAPTASRRISVCGIARAQDIARGDDNHPQHVHIHRNSPVRRGIQALKAGRRMSDPV